ncbi:MAG: hypothetical protein FWE41_01035 [Coriobacteriia bacterium]|nr:hypothetical protein [Coriobacteriia bacterium]MCL2750548.1 hypothetical protein [Coriobacteriia bacterium]
MNDVEQRDGVGETEGDGSSVSRTPARQMNRPLLSHQPRPSVPDPESSPQASAPEPEEIDFSGLPKYNLGALFMPAVWGPAHGQWISILFYPLWLFADTSITNAVLFGGFTYILAASVIIGTAALTIFYARTVGYKAYARVAHKVTKEQYLKSQRKWTVISILIAIVFAAFATWYNLTIRLPQGLS